MNEIMILWYLKRNYASKGKGIIKLISALENSTRIIIVMEYFANKTLSQYLQNKPAHKVPEPLARGIFRQIATAIAYIHSKNVVHLDIKLENILIDKR